MRQRAFVLAVTVDPAVVEADLVAGRLCCPGCGARLAAWGYAREREVRMLDGVRSLRPRRAYCRACETTHVLLPAFSVPRRRDGAEVIGAALLDKAAGAGHRTIASQPISAALLALHQSSRRATRDRIRRDAVSRPGARSWLLVVRGSHRLRPPKDACWLGRTRPTASGADCRSPHESGRDSSDERDAWS